MVEFEYMESAVGGPTFAGVNIGAAASDRVIIVAVTANASLAVRPTAVTIGGIAATLIGEPTAGTQTLSLAYASVPTGTTATVDLTLNIASDVSIHVCRMTGQEDSTHSDVGLDAPNPSSYAARSAAVDVPEAGAITAFCVSTSSEVQGGWTDGVDIVQEVDNAEGNITIAFRKYDDETAAQTVANSAGRILRALSWS